MFMRLALRPSGTEPEVALIVVTLFAIIKDFFQEIILH